MNAAAARADMAMASAERAEQNQRASTWRRTEIARDDFRLSSSAYRTSALVIIPKAGNVPSAEAHLSKSACTTRSQ
jgi:hypothetical protein